MSTVYLDPTSQLSSKKLPPTGTYSNVTLMLPDLVYTSSAFITGAVNAVALAYDFYVGNILDIELEERNVYRCYQLAVLKYSYLVNTHHAKNILYEMMGFQTATFAGNGTIETGQDVGLLNPNFSLAYARNIGAAFGGEVGVGGYTPTYSASFSSTIGQQDYDLQDLIGNSAEFSGIVSGKKLIVKEVFYKTPYRGWRFFGMGWGSYGVVGGMNNYGNYANGSTFQVTPVWEDKLRLANFEDALWTRTSHYSYELVNNKLRLYPIPSNVSPSNYWIRFSIDDSPLSASNGIASSSINGINNMNTLPLGNLPVENINGPGHMWIKEYFLALCAKTLALVRGKFGSIPLHGGRSITLNSADLLSTGKDDLKDLEDKLIKLLDDMAKPELAKKKQEQIEANTAILAHVPLFIHIK